jgi:hypothetical protein
VVKSQCENPLPAGFSPEFRTRGEGGRGDWKVIIDPNQEITLPMQKNRSTDARFQSWRVYCTKFNRNPILKLF